MAISYCFTYSQTTPESTEIGDNSDRGFWAPGGWRFSTMDGYSPDNDTTEHWTPGQLRYALQTAMDQGCYDNDSGFYEHWRSYPDYISVESATTEELTFHVQGVTPATRRRITRLLNGAPIFG